MEVRAYNVTLHFGVTSHWLFFFQNDSNCSQTDVVIETSGAKSQFTVTGTLAIVTLCQMIFVLVDATFFSRSKTNYWILITDNLKIPTKHLNFGTDLLSIHCFVAIGGCDVILPYVWDGFVILNRSFYLVFTDMKGFCIQHVSVNKLNSLNNVEFRQC